MTFEHRKANFTDWEIKRAWVNFTLVNQKRLENVQRRTQTTEKLEHFQWKKAKHVTENIEPFSRWFQIIRLINFSWIKSCYFTLCKIVVKLLHYSNVF